MALQSACASGAIALWRRECAAPASCAHEAVQSCVALMHSMRQGRPKASGMTDLPPQLATCG
eukprot:919306-Prymnesium_polylepis.1